jgi:Rha family phage regulatory protein
MNNIKTFEHELIKVDIKNYNNQLVVSSRAIAEGLEKNHKDVLGKIREILNEREFSPVEYIDAKGETRPEYLVTKNGFILLVMNYSGYNNFKRAYINRFNEMEKELLYGKVPKTYVEALRMYANEVEQKELIQNQRDEAIRTKAWISDKKAATAMNTASQKSKENKKLQTLLDKSKEYASIKRVEIQLCRKFDWRKLRDFCTGRELEMPKIFDANYGHVRTYPAEAWLAVYSVDLEKIS